MKAVLLAAIVVVLVSAVICQRDPNECPNPVDCSGRRGDLCAECPTYEPIRDRVVCEMDNCNGECKARWYRTNGRTPPRRLNEITDKCPLKTCISRDKDCGPRGKCIEQERKCNNTRGCERRFTLTCEPVDDPMTPSSCDDLQCGRNRECVVKMTRLTQIAQCRNTNPTNCREKVCDEGMECVMRARINRTTVEPVCVLTEASRAMQRGEDCTTLTCEPGMICEVTNNGRAARCVRMPVPRECGRQPGQLTCETEYQCAIKNNRAVCVVREDAVALSCRDIDCERGSECKFTETRGPRRFIPKCVPIREMCPTRRRPLSCRELVCGRGHVCRERRDENDGRTKPGPRCVHRGRFYSRIIIIFTLS